MLHHPRPHHPSLEQRIKKHLASPHPSSYSTAIIITAVRTLAFTLRFHWVTAFITADSIDSDTGHLHYRHCIVEELLINSSIVNDWGSFRVDRSWSAVAEAPTIDCFKAFTRDSSSRDCLHLGFTRLNGSEWLPSDHSLRRRQ